MPALSCNKPTVSSVLLCRLEHVLARSAQRANPFVGDILKAGSRGDTAVRVTHGRIVDILAYRAYPFLHHFLLSIFQLQDDLILTDNPFKSIVVNTVHSPPHPPPEHQVGGEPLPLIWIGDFDLLSKSYLKL
jgi:hypothetical protein